MMPNAMTMKLATETIMQAVWMNVSFRKTHSKNRFIMKWVGRAR